MSMRPFLIGVVIFVLYNYPEHPVLNMIVCAVVAVWWWADGVERGL
jgi:hypothetical protein